MFKYKGGQKGGKGTYWNLTNGTRVDIAEEGILPGDEKSMYIRVPSIVLLLASPVTGILYVIASPLITALTTVSLAGEKILAGLFHLLAPFVSFGWRPKEGHLAGKKKRKTKN